MKHKLILTAATALVLCPVLYAQIAPAPAPPITNAPPTAASPAIAPAAITLRYKFVPGQVRRYSYNMDMQMQMLTGQTGGAMPMNMTMQMTMRQVVKSVRPSDGAATIATKIEVMHMLMNGTETPMPAAQKAKMAQPFTMVMLPTGKMLSMSMPGMAGMGAPGMDFSKNMFSGTAFLPDGPVKIGDQWNGAVDAAMAGIGSSYTATLTGIDQKDGATLATIENKTTGTIDKSLSQGMPATMNMQGTITGTGTQIFDTTAGSVRSATGTANTDMTMLFSKPAGGEAPAGMPSSMKMQMNMKFTMTRLSDTAQ